MLNSHSIHENLIFFISRLIQEFMTLMREHDLSLPQIYALMYLFHEGECQVSDIARLMEASNAAASQLIERLWQQGLVERREDPNNRRMKKISLSQKGSDLVREGILSNQFLGEIFSALTNDQIETIHLALGYLADAMRTVREKDTK